MMILPVVGLGACGSSASPEFRDAAMLSAPATTTGSLPQQASGVSTSQPISQATPAAVQAASAALSKSQPGSSDYRIGPGDGLDITVYEVPEFSKKVTVHPAGTVAMPLIGDVPVAGKTTKEVETHLVKVLGGKYLEKPSISVSVSEFNSHRVTMEGSFGRPGIFPVSADLTLLQALAQAGGLKRDADTNILIFRMEDGKRKAARFDVSSIRSGDAPDPQIRSGDVIVATNSLLMTTYYSVMKALPIVGMFGAI